MIRSILLSREGIRFIAGLPRFRNAHRVQSYQPHHSRGHYNARRARWAPWMISAAHFRRARAIGLPRFRRLLVLLTVLCMGYSIQAQNAGPIAAAGAPVNRVAPGSANIQETHAASPINVRETRTASLANTQEPRTASPATINTAAWKAIGLDQAAHTFTFKRALKVAIIDDGFDIDNPQWSAHIAHNEGDIPGNGIDDDHNGKIDDYEGWDFGDNDENVRPAIKMLAHEHHGTRVLGVFWQVLQQLSAEDLSGAGITILPIKAVCDIRLNNYLQEGYKGIRYAIDQKADIIICSWAGPSIAEEDKALFAEAREKGITVIAAAGNYYAMTPLYPGALGSVIDVAATDAEGKKLKLSNYGEFVDISAPGDSLITWDPYKKVPDTWLSETSAATPVIAAVVTAMRAATPSLSSDDVEHIIENTATPLEAQNPLYCGNLGAGLVNVAAIHEYLATTTDPHHTHTVFTQTKAFIPLQSIGTQTSGTEPTGTAQASSTRPIATTVQSSAAHPGAAQFPIIIRPGGKYQYIKFLLAPPYPDPATLPDLQLRIFRDGNTLDTLLRKDRLKIPLLLTADSIYAFRSMASGLTTRLHYGSSLNTRTSNHRLSPHPPQGWWYYEAVTIDSSTLYCNGNVTNVSGNEGYIEDGSGEATYTGRNDCKWQITAPEGKHLLITFDTFDTEPKLDQVYIFNGTSTRDPILAIFSGHKIPPTIRSWGNTVLVWFLTSEENNYQGWKLHYKVID